MEEIVNIFALGGLDERGKNCYVVEINNDIFVIDCGLKYPEKTMPGIDAIIADNKYLKENKERIKAYLITHSHTDVNGGLPYFLLDCDAPCYASARTIFFIKDAAKNSYIDISNTKFIEVGANSKVDIAGHEVCFFSMTHSAAGNYGIAIKTNHGYIVYSSDFIFDFSADSNYSCDLQFINEIAKEGVLCLMCESEGCETQGFTAPNHRVTPFIEKYFMQPGRIIISEYSQSAFGIHEILDLTRKYNRKICIYNRNVKKTIRGLIDLYATEPIDDIEVDYSYIDDHDDVVVLVAGVGKRVFRELAKLVDGNESKNFKMKESDRVIICSAPIPGLEVMAASSFDSLHSTGAKVVNISRKQVTSMHAHSEDIKMLIKLLKPKYYMPVKGEYRTLLANAMLAVDLNCGFNYGNVMVFDNGMVLRFVDGKKDNSFNQIIETGDTYIDGLGVGDVENHVIITRQKMADNGVVILGATVSKELKKVVAGVDCQMRGFVFLKDADNLVKDMTTIFIDTLNEYLNTPTQDLEECKKRIKEKIIFKVKRVTGKDPLIIPAVIEL